MLGIIFIQIKANILYMGSLLFADFSFLMYEFGKTQFSSLVKSAQLYLFYKLAKRIHENIYEHT